jgi:hypothetical protein
MITHVIYILTILIVSRYCYCLGQNKKELELYNIYEEQVEKGNEEQGIDRVINNISKIPNAMSARGQVYKRK